MRPAPTVSQPFAGAAADADDAPAPRLLCGPGGIFASSAYVQRLVTAAAEERRRRLGARAVGGSR